MELKRRPSLFSSQLFDSDNSGKLYLNLLSLIEYIKQIYLENEAK